MVPKIHTHPNRRAYHHRPLSVLTMALFVCILALIGTRFFNSGRAAQCPTGDLNSDCSVGVLDLSIFLNHWQQNGTGIPEDFNNDDTVNVLDLSILLSNWGQTAALGITPMTICSNGTTFCIGSTGYYPYGASFYSSAPQSGIDSNPAGAIALAQKQHLNAVRTSNWLSHNDTVAQAENTSSAEWTSLDTFIADAQNANPNIRVFLDISDFKIVLEKNCKNWVTDYNDWDTFINLVANHVNSVTGQTYSRDPEVILIGFSGEPRETNKYYANDGGSVHYAVTGTNPSLLTVTESNWGAAVQSSGSPNGCGDPTAAANDFYYTSRELTNYYARVEADWKTDAGTAILTLPGGLSKLDTNKVRTDSISDNSSSSTINDSSIVANDAGSVIVGTHMPTGAYVGTVTPGSGFTVVNMAGAPIAPTGSDATIDIRPNGGQDYRTIFANSDNDACAFKTYGGAEAFLPTGTSYCLNTLRKPSVNVEWGYLQGDGDTLRAQEFQGQFTNNNSAGIAADFYWNAGFQVSPTGYDVDDGTASPQVFNTIVGNAP